MRRRVDDHFQENIIVAHEPASQWLARHVNRAFAEWLNSTAPDDGLPEPDPETAARVAVLWERYFGRPL
jgi:hypothetical protein